MKVRLSEKIGRGYEEFWHFKGRYLAVKGSRGSKKSTTAAMKIIYMMMKYPLSNTIVLRQVFNTHRDSTWKQLKWAAKNLGVEELWTFTVSPLEATYNPTGQKIYFRGCDNSMSITSITAPVGFITYLWVEEAYQITNEDDFNKVDMSMRGELPPGYFKQVIFTFNPWNEQTWLKPRFFDTPNDENKLALTTTYRCNEWLGPDDLQLFEDMKRDNPARFRVEGDGEWGMDPEGLVFTRWETRDFDPLTLASSGLEHRSGMDVGWIDPSAIIDSLYDKENKTIYVFNEFYKSGCQLDELVKAIQEMNLTKNKLWVDAAEPRTVAYFKSQGINAVPCIKGRDSVRMGYQFLQDNLIVVHPKCINLINELKNLSYKKSKQTGEYTDDFDDHRYTHACDGLRYGYSDIYTNTKLKTLSKSALSL
jgi:phage terminase large subunit